MLRANINGMRFNLAWFSARLRGFRLRLPLVVLIAPLLFVCGVVFGHDSIPWVVAGFSVIFGGFAVHYGMRGGIWVCDGSARHPACAAHRPDGRRHLHRGKKLIPFLLCTLAFLGSAWLAAFNLTSGSWPWEVTD